MNILFVCSFHILESSLDTLWQQMYCHISVSVDNTSVFSFVILLFIEETRKSKPEQSGFIMWDGMECSPSG